VDAAGHGRTGCVRGRLSDSVVAVGELELDDVADGGVDVVRDEGVLRAADDDGDYLVGAAEGVCWEVLVRRRDGLLRGCGGDVHLMLGRRSAVLNAGPGSAETVAARRTETMKDFMMPDISRNKVCRVCKKK
jgi:hypothetical protein